MRAEEERQIPSRATRITSSVFLALLHPSSKGHGCVAATSSSLQTCDLLPSPDTSVSRISELVGMGALVKTEGGVRLPTKAEFGLKLQDKENNTRKQEEDRIAV